MSDTNKPIHQYACADLCDENMPCPERRNVAVVEPNLLHIYGGKPCFHGQIVTIRCYESNPLVRQTLTDVSGEGKVLVVDGGGSKRVALLGDQLASIAHTNGWAGVVIHGCLRDSSIVRNIPIGIRAIGTTPVKSSKEHPGERGGKVSFGGVEFVPGDWLYADEDGIIVSKLPLHWSKL